MRGAGAGNDPIQHTIINNAAPFWVDGFINPAVVPNQANILWNEVCGITPCHGLAWKVPAGLAPGASITLTSNVAGPNSYAPEYSIWPGWLVAGSTTIYVYADSWDPISGSAAVSESNETNNNAVIQGLTVTGLNPTQRPANPTTLPSRPRP